MIPDEVIEFFNLRNPFSCTMGPGVYSALKRNEYETVFLGNVARLACKADNLTAIYKPNV
jgi:hypothetical protein